MFLQKKRFFSKHRSSIVSSESLDLDFVIIFQERLPKIVYFDEQLFVTYLFANNKQLISLTNNEYSRTNEKHITDYRVEKMFSSFFSYFGHFLMIFQSGSSKMAKIV